MALGLVLLIARFPLLGAMLLFGMTALALAILRPHLLALGLVPVSVLVGVLPPGNEMLLGATALVVGGAVLHHLVTPTPGRVGRYLAVAGVFGLLLTASVVGPDRLGYLAPALPVDFPDIIVGLLLMVAVILFPPAPRMLAGTVVVTAAAMAAFLMATDSYVLGRLAGLTVNANYLATFLAAALAAGVALARRPAPHGSWWLIPSAVCLIGLVQTHSRGALTAAVVGVVVALIAGRDWRWQLAGAVAATAILAVMFTVASPLQEAAFGGRTADQLSANNAIRAQAARVAVDLTLEHPLGGIGFGLFPYAAATEPGLGVFINTHNDYLKLAAEAGLPALVTFLILLIAGLTSPASAALIPVRAAVASGAVTLLFVNAISNKIVGVAFWLCLGCLLAYRARFTVPTPHASIRPDQHVREKTHA